MRPVVYVAAPYSVGKVTANVHKAMDWGDTLIGQGFAPIIPHLDHFMELAEFEWPYETWLDVDFALLSKCDAVLRIEGESPGADREVAFAKERGIPVFTDYVDLIDWRDGGAS